MFKGASPYADYVDTQFLIIVGICAVVFAGLLAAMIVFIVKYSRKKNPFPSNIEGNLPLEVIWTVIPLGLFMYMFYLGWEGYKMTIDIPPDAHVIKATARMWQWTFEYPNGVQVDTMFVPVNTPIKVLLHSADVNHAMFIPAFRIKKDVIPNRENVLWFKTPRIASYDIACAEYCGLRHSNMYTKVVAIDSASFENWYQAISTKQSKPYQPMLVATPSPTEPIRP